MQELLRKFVKARKLVCLSVLLDMLFFLSIGLIITPISNGIIKTAITIGQEVRSISLSDILGHSAAGKIFTYIVLFYIVIFALYVIFQGSNWWIADKIMGHKKKYFQYIGGFLKVNIVWGALLILAHFAYLLLNMRHQMQNVITPGITNIHGTIMTVMISAILILAFLSYPRQRLKAPFTAPLKKTIPIVIALVLLYGFARLPLPLYDTLPYISMIIVALITFTLLALLRVYTTHALK